MSNLFIRLIRIYQKFIRVLLPPCCRFHPSCSQYTIDAIQKYGILMGLMRSLGRIVRCSPLSSGGYDPVK